MKILVLLKQTPDTEAQIKISPDAKSLDSTGVKYIINPYDEYAIEEALNLKKKAGTGEVVLLSFSDNSVKERMLKGLAMGADKAIQVKNEGLETSDSLLVSEVLTAAIKEENPDIVFCGKQGIDDDNMHVPVMTAELLGFPHVNVVNKIDYADLKTLTVSREVEGGQVETFQVTLPCVIGAHKSLNTPRYASLPGIMKAKKKPFIQKNVSDLGLNEENLKKNQQTSVDSYALPPKKPEGKVFKDESIEAMVEKVVEHLRTEAKVL